MITKYYVYGINKCSVKDIYDLFRKYLETNNKIKYLYKKALYKYDNLEEKEYDLNGSIVFVKNIEHNKKKSIYYFMFETETELKNSCDSFLYDLFDVIKTNDIKIAHQIEK